MASAPGTGSSAVARLPTRKPLFSAGKHPPHEEPSCTAQPRTSRAQAPLGPGPLLPGSVPSEYSSSQASAPACLLSPPPPPECGNGSKSAGGTRTGRCVWEGVPVQGQLQRAGRPVAGTAGNGRRHRLLTEGATGQLCLCSGLPGVWTSSRRAGEAGSPSHQARAPGGSSSGRGEGWWCRV